MRGEALVIAVQLQPCANGAVDQPTATAFLYALCCRCCPAVVDPAVVVRKCGAPPFLLACPLDLHPMPQAQQVVLEARHTPQHSTEHDPSAVSVQCLSCAQQFCQSYEACSSERTSPAAVDEQLRHVIVWGAGPCEVGSSSCQPLQGFGASLAENVLLVLVVQHGMLGVMHKQRVEVVVRTGCG